MTGMTAQQFDSVTLSARTPNGNMFVTVLEDLRGKPVEIIIHAGKTGGAVHVWSQALGNTLTQLLKRGASVNDLIESLSNRATSEQPSRQLNGSMVRSGVDGVSYCLMEYRRLKYRDFRALLSHSDDDDYRPPRIVR